MPAPTGLVAEGTEMELIAAAPNKLAMLKMIHAKR
jgi:hypothetical protein